MYPLSRETGKILTFKEYKKFSKTCKVRKQWSNLSLRDRHILAKKCKTAYPILSKVMRGDRHLPLHWVSVLIKSLNVNLQDLVQFAEEVSK